MKYLVPILLLVLVGCTDICENTLIIEKENNQNGYTAVVFNRNCGATASLSKQVSLIPVGHRHTNKAGNIYTSEDYDDVRVSWIDFEKLEITCVGVG